MATIRERIGKDGKPVFHCQVRLRGAPPQTASFTRKTDAKKWVVVTEAAIKEERFFPGSTGKLRTLAELIDRYTENILPKKAYNSILVQRPQLAWWRERLGHLRISDVTPALIAECRDELAKRFKPATVTRYLESLNHVFVVGRREWRWCHANPIADVSKPSVPPGRVRFLSDDERARLLEACKASDNPNLLTIVTLALVSGLRKMELLSLRWQDIDLQKKTITLEPGNTKTRQARTIPIPDVAFPLLQKIPRRLDTPLLFPSQVDASKPCDIEQSWNTARKRAKLDNFVFHDLRHSCASYILMNGGSLLDAATILGHASVKMTQRYAHLSTEHQSKVMNRVMSAVLG